MIRVHEGGVRTTVQDAGRFGMYHLGMPPSGALDDYSFRAANLSSATTRARPCSRPRSAGRRSSSSRTQ